MKRKGSVEVMLGVALLAIVLAFALMGAFNFLFEIGVGGCPIVKPDFGRVECEPISHSPIILQQQSFNAEDYGSRALYRVKCGDDENTPSCDFVAQCNGGVGGQEFIFQITNPAYNCQIGSSDWCNLEVNDRTPTIVASGSVGTTLQIGSCRKLGLFYYPGLVSTSFLPYGLNVYDSGAKFRYDTQSCALDEWSFGDRNNIAYDCGDVPNCNRDLYDINSNILGYDDWINYVTGFEYVPEGIDSSIVIYQGKTAWCFVDKVWQIDSLDTVGGCFRVPTTVLADVDCCPGMQGPNVECGSDFLWHQISTDPQCGKVSIAQCYGIGEWVPDYSTPETDVTRATGIDNNGCCIYESKLTQCVPPNIGCPAGYVCDEESFTCVLQQGPGIICGDGVCSAPYENTFNCPVDCGTAQPFDWNILWIVILVALFALIGFKTAGGVGAAIGGIMGGIVGYLIYLVLTWWIGLNWWEQVLLGIGGFLGGGIFAYLFGGAFIGLIVLIIYAIRK